MALGESQVGKQSSPGRSASNTIPRPPSPFRPRRARGIPCFHPGVPHGLQSCNVGREHPVQEVKRAPAHLSLLCAPLTLPCSAQGSPDGMPWRCSSFHLSWGGQTSVQPAAWEPKPPPPGLLSKSSFETGGVWGELGSVPVATPSPASLSSAPTARLQTPGSQQALGMADRDTRPLWLSLRKQSLSVTCTGPPAS